MQELSLIGDKLGGMAVAAWFVSSWPCLQIPDLSADWLRGSAIEHLNNRMLPKLRSLKSSCSQLDEEATVITKLSRLSQLSCLSLSHSNLHAVAIWHLVSANWKELQELTCHHVNVTKMRQKSLLKAAGPCSKSWHCRVIS